MTVMGQDDGNEGATEDIKEREQEPMTKIFNGSPKNKAKGKEEKRDQD